MTLVLEKPTAGDAHGCETTKCSNDQGVVPGWRAPLLKSSSISAILVKVLHSHSHSGCHVIDSKVQLNSCLALSAAITGMSCDHWQLCNCMAHSPLTQTDCCFGYVLVAALVFLPLDLKAVEPGQDDEANVS